jgi:hypothetical protein
VKWALWFLMFIRQAKINLINKTFHVFVLNIINYVVAFCSYLCSFWCKVIGLREDFVILYVNMRFLSCKIAVPKVLKYGGFVNLDFLCLYNCELSFSYVFSYVLNTVCL